MMRLLSGAGGKLIETETELRSYGEKVIEDVGLDALELIPHLVCQKEIHLDREPELTGLPLCYYEVEFLCHQRVLRQVQTYIYTVKL